MIGYCSKCFHSGLMLVLLPIPGRMVKHTALALRRNFFFNLEEFIFTIHKIMLPLLFRVQQHRLRLGLRSRPRWWSSQSSPENHYLDFKRFYSMQQMLPFSGVATGGMGGPDPPPPLLFRPLLGLAQIR